MSNRIDWIDTAKGIGIILVVVAHVLGHGYVSEAIYIYHMPLFFFISGYLFKSKYSMKEYIKHKSKSLLLPYLTFFVIFVSLQYGVKVWVNNPHLLMFLLYGGENLTGYLGVFWFISTLYITQQIFNVLSLVGFTASRKLIAIGFFFLILAYINYLLFPNYKTPFDINVVLYTLPIFVCGNLLRKYEYLVPHKKYLILMTVLIFIGCYFYPAISIDLKHSVYGIPFLSFAIGIVLIEATKMLAEYLSKKIIILSYIGQASIIIMFMHQFIQLYINSHFTENIIVRILLGLFIPYFCYFLFKRFKLTRIFFIGQSK